MILSIAGSDSGAGAGVQADLRTAQALGAYATTAVSAVTAQNLKGIEAWRPVPAELIGRQVAAVLRGFPVQAIKTGLLPGAAAVEAIAAELKPLRRIPLVVDPVIGSTSGTQFLGPDGIRALKRELFPLAWLVTPNWPEAAALTGWPVESLAQAESAARRLVVAGCAAALVKGGHGSDPTVSDVLVMSDGTVRRFSSPRIETPNTHGTGCVLSTAIAVHLAQGVAFLEAIARSRDFLLKALTGGKSKDWGGRGPAFT